MNKKIVCLIAAALIGCCNLVNAQKKQRTTEQKDDSSTRAFVELKDGSQLLGNILSDDDLTLEFEMIDSNVLILKHGYIREIKKEGKDISLTRGGRYNYNRGLFINIMPIGFGLNFGTNGPGGTFSSQLVAGYQLNKRLGIGGGFGFEYLAGSISDNFFDFWILPTYAYTKYNINLNGPRVYALGKLGAARVIQGFWRNDDINTSLYTALGFGVAFPTKWAGRFVFELSNSMVLTKGTLFNWDSFGNPITQEFRSLVRRPSLKVGIAFGQ